MGRHPMSRMSPIRPSYPTRCQPHPRQPYPHAALQQHKRQRHDNGGDQRGQ
jgi:hypothetical protein